MQRVLLVIWIRFVMGVTSFGLSCIVSLIWFVNHQYSFHKLYDFPKQIFILSSKKEKSTNSIKGYINFSKKYTGQYGGIRISSDDMQNYGAILIDQEGDGDLESLIHNELRQILDNTPNHRRKVFYMVLKDIGCHISE